MVELPCQKKIQNDVGVHINLKGFDEKANAFIRYGKMGKHELSHASK
jgi:hypothetical protein